MVEPIDTSTLGPIRIEPGVGPHGDLIIGEIIRNWLEGRFELMEADVFPDLMVKAGYARKVGFDPKQHTDEHGVCPAPGDDWYELTEAGIKARDTQ